MTEDDRLIGEDDLDGFIDGQLSERRAGEVARYLAANPQVAARVEQDRAARDDLRQRLAFIAEQPIPSRLRVAAIQARRRAVWMGRLRVAAACAGLVIAGGASGWEAHAYLEPPAVPQMRGLPVATADAISAHRVYSMETIHAVEVAAAQEAHLVQWLSRRIGQKLTVPDLNPQGFALMGGRLLPTGSASAAQFMYENRTGQRLTLYVRANAGDDTEFRFAQTGDIGAFSWNEEGLGFAMVGSISREALLGLAETVWRQLDPARPVPKPSL